MQESHEARLTFRGQHIGDLPDNAPFRGGAGPVYRKIAQETVVIINRRDQVWAGQEVVRIQVVENPPHLGNFLGHLRFNFRRRLDVLTHGTRNGAAASGPVCSG